MTRKDAADLAKAIFDRWETDGGITFEGLVDTIVAATNDKPAVTPLERLTRDLLAGVKP